MLNTYAKQILETIQRDGFYVRVPAGKQFYLYVTQTMDRSKAVIGGTRLAAIKTADAEKEDPNDPLVALRKNLQRLSAPAKEPGGAPSLTLPSILSPQPTTR